MVIIAKTTPAGFTEVHAAAKEPLNNWYIIAKKAEWKNFNEIKNAFGSVDAVGNDRYCFNIKGNDFRLIVLILFKIRAIFILWFGTHTEYDKLNKQTGADNVNYKK
ncbi:MAG TPA: type II toxin-antitoxin system HigB family toxin [Chitinophagaceae bacterium]|jgi:mRNA interferase HigB|nr:type II toxin-antitoxin system HigB family toxin [Chitinophagaceae bacterium]